MRYITPSGLTTDLGDAVAVDHHDDGRTTYALPLYEGSALVSHAQWTVEDPEALREACDYFYQEHDESHQENDETDKGTR